MVSKCCNFSAVAILLALALMAGCGKKTDVVPLQNYLPVAIDDLHYMLDESGVRLQWSYPVKMENGDDLQAVESFEVLRAEVPAAEYCEGCPVRFVKHALIEGGVLPGTGQSKAASYRDTELQAGYQYLYKVRSRGGRWYASGDSNAVSFAWETVK